VRLPIAALLIAGLTLLAAIVAGSLYAAGAPTRTVGVAGVAVVVIPCLVYLGAFVRPVYLISAAVFCSMFSGNWRAFGLPAMLSPDRYFFIAGIAAFVLRDPASGERRPLRFSYVHVLLLLAGAYTVASAIGAHTLFNKADLWPLVDRFGLVPFALFVVAPGVFATERDRRILLVTLVVMAAYLGFIATAQGIGANSLLWPRYIVQHNAIYGPNHVLLTPPQSGRARGPFQDSAANGVALFYAAIACALAFWAFRRSPWRWLIALIGCVCLFDVVFTLERSVWLGVLIGIPLMMLASRRLRVYLPIVILVGALGFGGALLGSHRLRNQVFSRVTQQQSVWDRYNLDTAAERMFLARPLMGFGWGQYLTQSLNYFKLAATYPITAVGEPDHSVELSNLAELGLIGTGLWALALVFGIGGAIFRRGPPELVPWRIGLIGVLTIWLAVSSLSPLFATLPNQLLWLWAGVAWPVRYGAEALQSRRSGSAPSVEAPAARMPTHQRVARPVRHRDAAHAPGARVGVRTWLLALGVSVLAALGFLAGQASAGGSTATTIHASASGVQITYPSAWRQTRATASLPGLSDELALAAHSNAGGALVIGRSTTPDPTLLPSELIASLPRVPSPQIVSLGAWRMYRYLNVAPRHGTPIASVYALPTTAGTIVAACVAPAGSAGVMSACERILATIKLASGSAQLLAPSATYARALSAVIGKLNPVRSRAAAQLRSAHDPASQLRAAQTLAAAHAAAATAVSRLQPGAARAANAAVASALRAVSAGYGLLAKAAQRNDVRAYGQAQKTVIHANRALTSAFVGLAQFGYQVG
jgi:hypothetical protein